MGFVSSDTAAGQRHARGSEEPVCLSGGKRTCSQNSQRMFYYMLWRMTPSDSQACLPIYVSALKRGFSLAMGIKFGSGVFWVSAVCSSSDASCEAEDVCCWTAQHLSDIPLISSAGGFTCYEHQPDGSDQKETGVHGAALLKQICSRCLLATVRRRTSYLTLHM